MDYFCSATSPDECKAIREREVAGTDAAPRSCEPHDNPQPCPLGYGHPDQQPAGACWCRATHELTSDIIITAVEGGIGYWATVSGYKNCTAEGPHARACVIEQGASSADGKRRRMVLDRKAVLVGIERVLRPSFNVRSDIRTTVAAAMVDDDAASDIDAEIADVIVQAAMFDEIVYG